MIIPEVGYMKLYFASRKSVAMSSQGTSKIPVMVKVRIMSVQQYCSDDLLEQKEQASGPECPVLKGPMARVLSRCWHVKRWGRPMLNHAHVDDEMTIKCSSPSAQVQM